MANKDFYNRIADALQIISGDDSHVDDDDKNMDYYKRIAQALEKISESGGGSSSGGVLVIGYSSFDILTGVGTLDHTWQEIHDAMASGLLVVLSYTLTDENVIQDIVTKCNSLADDEYKVTTTVENYFASSPDGYPSNEGDVDPVS